VFQKRTTEDRVNRMALESRTAASGRQAPVPPAGQATTAPAQRSANPCLQWINRHLPGYRHRRLVEEMLQCSQADVENLGRSWQVASASLGHLGRQVARLENAVDQLKRGADQLSGGSQAEAGRSDAE
jgi:hypothetical protein